MSLRMRGVHSLGCVSVRVYDSGCVCVCVCVRARACSAPVRGKRKQAVCILFSLEK